MDAALDETNQRLVAALLQVGSWAVHLPSIRVACYQAVGAAKTCVRAAGSFACA